MGKEHNQMIEKPKYGIMAKVAVLCIIVIQYTVTISSPLLGVIAQQYPQYPILVKQIETIPTLAAIIPSLLIGPLNKYMTKKNMLLLGTVLAFAQFVPAIVPGFWPLYISRFVAGLGLGFMYSFAASFIVDMFDGAEQNMMMGLRSAVGAIAGIIFMQISGSIAVRTGSYQKSFMVALVLIPIFLIELFCMPKTNPIEEANRAAARSPKSKAGESKEKNFTGLTWAFIVMTVVNILFAYTFMSNAAIITCAPVEAGGLGMDASKAAMVMSVFSGAMAVSGFIFGPVWMRLFKNFTTAVGITFCFIGLVICYLSGSFAVMVAGALIYGFGFQIYNGAICLLLPLTSRPQAATTIIAVFFAFQNLGSFLATVITPNISKALFPGQLKGDWKVAIVGLLICAVIYFILCRKADARAKRVFGSEPAGSGEATE